MHLRSIVLRLFRSHHHLSLAVDPGVNLFLGSNGAGKTNLVEAIAVLATGVSPRGADPESMVQWGESGFAVQGDFAYDDDTAEPMSLEMKYRTGSSRTVRQNGSVTVRLRDLLGKVPVVSFVPEDLALVKGEPELRRRALNMVLMQVDPVYADALRRYTEALKSRNAALRQLADGAIPREALEPWNRAVIGAGLAVCRKRAQFLDDFSTRVAAIQERMTRRRETVRLDYKPSFGGPWDESAADRWLQQFRRTEAQELAVGSTMTGPHRDDVIFMLNDRPARSFASEGQMRTCAVAFKLAEVPFVQERLGQKPICLLDDVLSELDLERAELLLAELSQTGQCFVTMTGLESWPRHCRLPAAIYHVDRAGVRRETPPQAEETLPGAAPVSGGVSFSAQDVTRSLSLPN